MAIITQLTKLPEKIDKEVTLILDTETTGLNKLTDKPFMLVMEYYDMYPHEVCLEWTPSVARWLTNNLPRAKRVVAHNAKYDWHMMRNGEVNSDALYNTNIFCTFVAEALIDENRLSYSLDSLGELHFGIGKDTALYEELGRFFGVEASKKLMGRLYEYARYSKDNWNRTGEYAIQDIRVTKRLYHKQVKDLSTQELDRVMALEMRTLKTLVEMEKRGVRVDLDRVERVAAEMEMKQEEIQDEIKSILGWEVNPRSPIQMANAFTQLGIPLYIPKGKKGPSFAKEVLERLDHPFIKALQNSRSVKTMLDTFIHGSIAKNVNGRIHTDFNQVKGDASGSYYGTSTGRMSSSNPNLQQIPKRDGELAPMVRGLFCAEPGKLWIANDWEQFEFRVFAHYVKDDVLTARYNKDPKTDFHTAMSEMTGKPRDKAKRINLGMVFGMGEGKLASECGLPYEVETRHGKEILIAGPEAQALFAEYHGRFPKAKAFLQEASHLAKRRGYIKTIYGRRIRFPRGEFVHKAGGLVFQGTSADLMKQKLCELNDEFRHTDVSLNLVVHDEFDAEAPEDQAKGAAKRIKEITEDIPELRIPILADAGIGANWWDACTT